jgi:hypothetical protein
MSIEDPIDDVNRRDVRRILARTAGNDRASAIASDRVNPLVRSSDQA